MPPIPSKERAKEQARADKVKARVFLPAPLRSALELLDLGWPVTEDEARGAFRKVALLAHPDRGGSNEVMLSVNKAYELISKAIRERQRNQADFGAPWEHRDWDFPSRTYQARPRPNPDWWYESRRTPSPEPCEYEPAASTAEAMTRINDLSRSSFVNLKWWPPSRNNPNNVARLWLGVRFTIFYIPATGMYGWCMGLEGSPHFGSKTYSTRRECVRAMADILMLKN